MKANLIEEIKSGIRKSGICPRKCSFVITKR